MTRRTVQAVLLACLALALLSTGCEATKGDPGSSCSVKDNGNGTKTITCTDGTTATVADGTNGANGANGAKGADGTDGTNGTNGTNGANGSNGKDGTNCTVKDNGDGTKTISCSDGTSVIVANGTNGAPGAASFNVTAEPPPVSLSITVTSIVIASPPVVKFTVKDNANRGAAGLVTGSSGQLRFGLAKLIAGADGGADHWQSYITRTSNGNVQGTTERTGALIDNKDGTYQYTFVTDVKNVSGIPWEPALTHRLVIQLSGSVAYGSQPLPYTNAAFDFVPNGGSLPLQKEIAATASCNECHNKLAIHGSRVEMKYCVVCHNQSSFVSSTQTIDLANMTHAIHGAAKRAADGAPLYTIGSDSFGEVTYPQDLGICRKCHDGANPATPQGDAWNQNPTRASCGGCHAKTGAHPNNLPNDSGCKGCHLPADIKGYHMNDNSTPHSPDIPAGLYKMGYEIKEVTVANNTQPVVKFKITKDGTPLDFNALPADLIGAPSFLVAYSMVPGADGGSPQDGGTSRYDWNQLGRAVGQPQSVALNKFNLDGGSSGTLVGPDDAGYWTATITEGDSGFPAGSVMRGIALQGYYSQDGGIVDGGRVAKGRHAVSAYMGVKGEAARRSVVDSEKCSGCHEWFEGHGGNRVKTVEVCAICHNPNLTTSGRATDPNPVPADGGYTLYQRLGQANWDALDAGGYDPSNPLTYPETTNNLRDMIHGIHAAAMREAPFREVRDRTSSTTPGPNQVYYYDFSEVTYPANPANNCLMCHKTNTYRPTSIPADAFNTTTMIPGTDRAAIVAARKTVPNATDLVNSKWTGVCVYCHNTQSAMAHYGQMGGQLDVARSSLDNEGESCEMCHGLGKLAEVDVSHGFPKVP